MEKINFTAFDFETATTNRMPCQLGLVVVRGGQVVEEKCWLIKPPGNRFDDNCTRVHGISARHTENEKEFCDLWDEIKPYFQHEVIVAHSAEFDIDVLERAVEYYNLQSIVLAVECTKRIYRDRSLDDVLTALNIPQDNRHNALIDANFCAQIFIEYLNGVNPQKLKYPKKQSKDDNITFFFKEGKTVSREAKTQDLSCVENKETIFYDKIVVISGEFENFPERENLAMILKNLGAKVNASISRKTNFFIIGEDFGPKKMEQAKQLQTDGYDIKILNEIELMNELNKINHGN